MSLYTDCGKTRLLPYKYYVDDKIKEVHIRTLHDDYSTDAHLSKSIDGEKLINQNK